MNYKPEEKIACPYNKVHRLTRERMNYHIVKCRRNFQGDNNMVACSFDATHMVPEIELQYHEEQCEKRREIEAPIYGILAPKVESKITLPPRPEFEVEESWDTVEVPSYNPESYASRAKIIRNPSGKIPSVRKEFTLQERERLAQLEEYPNYSKSCTKTVKLPQHRPVS